MRSFWIACLYVTAGIFALIVSVHFGNKLFGNSLRRLHYVRVDEPALTGGSATEIQGDLVLTKALNEIREKYRSPALGGAIVTEAGVTKIAVAGVRKRGTTVAATVQDQWHLGSNTKAMTATMIAELVQDKKLAWESTLAAIFPELGFGPEIGSINLRQLLSHRAGLPANLEWNRIAGEGGSLRGQRLRSVLELKSVVLRSPPGATFFYSNLGYVIAAAMAERVSSRDYEDLMRDLVFVPLEMSSAGFGVPGTPGKIDQPMGHNREGEAVSVDNPLVMAPAGGVHCSLTDWGKFVAEGLKANHGEGKLLSAALQQTLYTPAEGGNYAMGWTVVERPWAGGKALTHNGSNVFNFSLAWVAPARGFAGIVVCNEGSAAKECDEAAGQLIRAYGAK